MADTIKSLNKRLKTVEEAMTKFTSKYSKIDKLEQDLTAHVVTPDAHNAYILAKDKK